MAMGLSAILEHGQCVQRGRVSQVREDNESSLKSLFSLLPSVKLAPSRPAPQRYLLMFPFLGLLQNKFTLQ